MTGPGNRGISLALAVALGLIAGAPAHANLIANGSFETGPAPGVSLQLAAGATDITGWTVTRTNIDYVGTAWTAASGGCSIGLNGTDAGGIAQTFATLAHAQYTVRFYMAGDPFSTPTIKTMRVAAAGQSADFTADITGMWPWDPGWNPHVWSFNATGPSTTLEFFSLDTGDTGPALDSVTVELTSLLDVASAGTSDLTLSAMAPNPTRGASQVMFTLPREMPVRLGVFDLSGREVAILADGTFPAGSHTVVWNGRAGGTRAAAGLYLVEMRAPGLRLARRLIVLR